MGENHDGVWFYKNDEVVLNNFSDSSFKEIPEGDYAAITITDPMTFSLNKAWNYMCEWFKNEKKSIREVELNTQISSVCFVKFFMENGAEFMTVLIPIF